MIIVDSPIVAIDNTHCAVSEQVVVTHKYEVPEVLYRNLRNVISSIPLADSRGWNTPTNDGRMYFKNDFLRLNFPVPHCQSHDFFTAVVDHFAMDIGADLIRLSLDSIERLVSHYAHIRKKSQKQCNSDPNYLDQLFPKDSASRTKGKKETFPFDEIFKLLAAKSNLDIEAAGTGLVDETFPPLIIHVPEVFQFTKTSWARRISECIRDAVRKLDHSDGRVLVIGTDKEGSCSHFEWRRTVMQEGNDDNDRYCHGCNNLIYLLQFGHNPAPLAHLMMPIYSEEQRLLLINREKSYIEYKNISNIQLMVRQRLSIDQNSTDLLPYAEWEFQNSVVTDILRKDLFSIHQLDMISQAISDISDISYIEYAILRSEELPIALRRWNDQSPKRRWAKAPAHIQKAIAIIQGDEDKYKKEIALLDSVVDASE